MAKKYKCPYCEKRLIRKDLITHIDKSHKELIPENYTAARLVYNQVNKVDHGKCRVCGKSTAWSEKSGRYDVLCGDPKCKEHMREEYKKNMLRVKGTYNILNDPEQQKKMLANRSISGQYKFHDGGVLTYTGSYEKKCLEFMNVVMQIPSKDILSPGPTLEYEYNGEKHFYITDFYYIPYNLIIEVKDGGDNLNTKDSASMKASREKTIEKERLITDRGEYNYIRLTNNNFAQLIEVFMIIKEKLLEGDDSKTYRINESQVVLEDYFDETGRSSKFIRVTYDGEGIYQAFKESVSFDVWKSFKNSNAANWLPLPPLYEGNYRSYFTTTGYKMFMKRTYPVMIEYLDKSKIKVEEVYLQQSNIIYEDKFQVVISEDNTIDESLEDISGVVFGKRKLIQDKYITLYHGTSIKDLPLISPLSINVGLKNANPKMSSFWFNNLDYAITFSTMDYIARNLNDKDACRSMVLDNDMKVLIDNKYKSKVIASIKNGESYVYERTVESKYVGYGHNGVFPEYTLDIPVKPDRYYVIKFKDMVSKIKFVSENYIKSIKQKYADGKMDFGNNKMQLLMDRVFYYSGHNDKVDKIKQARAYNKISLNDILYLNKMLNQYEYIIPNNGNIITQISEDSFNKYKLLSPDEFKKYKGGICWDYVVYEAYWFDRYFTNIPYSVYFEVLDNKTDCPTHTFLIFEYGGKYYWFESSWKPMCGIYGGFDTEKDAIDYVMSKLNDGKSNYKNYICEYDPLDSKMFGMNSKQFMDYLLPKVKPYKFPNRVETPTTVIKGTTPEHKSY